MNLDILANGAPPPWRRKNDGKDSEKGSGPPSGGDGEIYQMAGLQGFFIGSKVQRTIGLPILGMFSLQMFFLFMPNVFSVGL